MEMVVDKEFANAVAEALIPKLVPAVVAELKKQPVLEKRVSRPELAKLLGISYEDIGKYMNQDMPHTFAGKTETQPRFKPSEVSRWLDEHHVKGWGSYE